MCAKLLNRGKLDHRTVPRVSRRCTGTVAVMHLYLDAFCTQNFCDLVSTLPKANADTGSTNTTPHERLIYAGLTHQVPLSFSMPAR